MQFESRFEYSGPTTLDMTRPIRRPEPEEGSVGGSAWSGAGIPAAYRVRKDSDIVLWLRFTEAQWPAVAKFINTVQLGEKFTWYPDKLLATSHQVYLVEPAPGSPVRPTPDPEAWNGYQLQIRLRADPAAAVADPDLPRFDIRYFGG